MSSHESSTPIVQEAKEVVNDIAAKPIVQDAKHEAQHAVDKINSQPIVQNAKHEAKHIVEKVSDVAHRADPRDLTSGSVVNGLKQVDRTILRLNKLLASPGGLSAFLSTFNYSLYILAYVQTKSSSISAFATQLLALTRPACDDTKLPVTALINNAGVPAVAALAILISKARTTLRLFGLFPLYAWLRTLVTGPKAGADPVLHRIALLQASSYFTYQALENVSLLADSGAVGPAFIARINRGDSKTARVYLWAYRAWLGGVSCDFLRLAREWQLESKRRGVRKQMQADGRALAEYQDEEDAKFDKRWWTDLVIASAWLPMALHYSSAEGGIPGWNLGWMGACGLVAGSARVKALWASTAVNISCAGSLAGVAVLAMWGRYSRLSGKITMTSHDTGFNIVEASIEDHRQALDAGKVTSVELVISYLNRIATYDICGGLNAFTVFSDSVLDDAAASDARRAQGLQARPLEGVPYTIKDSYKIAGMSVTNGSPALEGLISSEDSAIAGKLREAGTILIGKTNMPPMAAGGMQRGLYGRAESPYNSKYLTAAFSSGSSNGAATSLASSMAAFGMGSETVSSGRSPASNNAIVCYTPSKGLLSCRGLWPLYITCDVPTPLARSMDDMLTILSVVATEDLDTTGDFIREQTHISIPKSTISEYQSLKNSSKFKGTRIGVPKMYVGQKDADPHAKNTHVSREVIAVWQQAEKDLQALGAEIVYTDFPLVTNYENDSVSGEANNVDGRPGDWNLLERGILIAKAWDTFLVQNKDKSIKSLADIKDSSMLFPKPPGYLPDTFLEIRNWIDYPGLPALMSSIKEAKIEDIEGMKQALCALDTQRKRDLEDWMDANNLGVIAFPAQGDVGLADLEFEYESTKHSLTNGVKYSNGNRAIRHLGVPTVSVPMGMMAEKKMPVNITFAGKAYRDEELLAYAWAFEQATKRRASPPLAPLSTDIIPPRPRPEKSQLQVDATVISERASFDTYTLLVKGTVSKIGTGTIVEIFVDGKLAKTLRPEGTEWQTNLEYTPKRPECLGWDLKPLPPRMAMVIVVAKAEDARTAAKLVWMRWSNDCR
ncbi:amidase signature enzyme [Ophiobolus disseminans]|uniref:Amidase signature enzyme n=1 Tax=Ophiobolus disseminans TaxID=1469910 RepID=A0A6A6ZKP3_9PLEO|nr:amidase signature enzyme [Ophiobolus disseminans]